MSNEQEIKEQLHQMIVESNSIFDLDKRDRFFCEFDSKEGCESIDDRIDSNCLQFNLGQYKEVLQLLDNNRNPFTRSLYDQVVKQIILECSDYLGACQSTHDKPTQLKLQLAETLMSKLYNNNFELNAIEVAELVGTCKKDLEVLERHNNAQTLTPLIQELTRLLETYDATSNPELLENILDIASVLDYHCGVYEESQPLSEVKEELSIE